MNFPVRFLVITFLLIATQSPVFGQNPTIVDLQQKIERNSKLDIAATEHITKGRNPDFFSSRKKILY